jgi:3-deoxy-manno-octulosonate cytidylyltransferase (CMP-KDO synthetase)
MKTLAVIPARLASTRLPRKLLREIAGRPLLAWTVDAARACPQIDRILVAADSDEIAGLCRRLDVACVLTSPELPSGTDRMHAAAQFPGWNDADVYLNLQGDEPFLRQDHIAALLRPFALPGVDVTTLKVPCTPENISNPNAVKVVTASDGRALYFSRATIPYHRDQALAAGTLGARGIASDAWVPATPAPQYWKHIGLYAYRKRALDLFPALPPSALERIERLEQLRLLENGLSLYVEPTPYDTIGIDTEADLLAAEQLLLARSTL